MTTSHRMVRGAVAAGVVLAFSLQLTPSFGAAAASGIGWQMAASDAEVDKAFSLAKSSGKPVFLYWGAVWCPPCNQVKATLFSRPDFVERSRAFVPVYVDGDRAGAQKVAARFKVQGYPTMIVFKPDGTEITRLPGEVDPERYLLTLSAGLNAQVPVKELMRRGLAKQSLTPEQWRLLAFYSWDTDEQQVSATADLPGRLNELAAAAPTDLPQVRDRLAFKSLATRAEETGKPDAAAVEAGRKLVDRVLADPAGAAQLADVLVGRAESVVKYLAPAGETRRVLAGRWDGALVRLLDASTLSRADRVDAFDARVALWKMMDGTDNLSGPRKTEVIREMARLVAATTDKYERQAVVPGAAHVLAQAGLLAESDELLKFELPHAVAPYYHMLVLAGNAKKRNDAKSALSWYEQAWRKSEGPATRIQWGTGFVGHVMELTPNDMGRVESAATGVITQLDARSETFYERNQRSLRRMAMRLMQWQGSDPARARVVSKVEQQLTRTCARLPVGEAGRANCESVFSPAKS
ncbi:MAG: putative disulfide-isomerase [Ramlibacter sp.]|nr:putative disulfide-isomerase [Ramlibacter sp.]